MRSEDHPPVLSMSMMGTPACLAAEEEAARVLCAPNLDVSTPARLSIDFILTADSIGTYSTMRFLISQKQLGFLFSK